MEFSKSLAKYYDKWYSDAVNSEIYCRSKGDNKLAEEYKRTVDYLSKLIDENREAIDFFSMEDNASKIDRALPEKFRGYK